MWFAGRASAHDDIIKGLHVLLASWAVCSGVNAKVSQVHAWEIV